MNSTPQEKAHSLVWNVVPTTAPISYRRTADIFYALTIISAVSFCGIAYRKTEMFGVASILLTPVFYLFYREFREPPNLSHKTTSRLEISDDRVQMSGDDGWSVERSLIAQAVVSPAMPVGAWVSLELKDESQLLFWIREIEEAHKVVQLLHQDECHTNLSRKIRGPLWSTWKIKSFFFILCVTILLYAVAYKITLLAQASVLTWGLLWIVDLIPQKLTIGTDAIHWNWLGFKRKIPLADILKVDIIPKSVVLTVRNMTSLKEKKIVIRTSGQSIFNRGMSRFLWGLETSLVAERICAAMKAGKSHGTTLELSQRYQGKLSNESVLDELKSLVRTNSAYRDTISEEALWNLAEGHQKSHVERLMAMVALSPTLDKDGRERLRIVMQTSANTKFQEAISSILKNDDAGLLETLEALKAEEASDRKQEAATRATLDEEENQIKSHSTM